MWRVWRRCEHRWTRLPSVAVNRFDLYVCPKCGASRQRMVPPKGYVRDDDPLRDRWSLDR
jgi:hypothetical protein